MIDYDVRSSPQLYARTGGALYLILILLGLFAEVFVRGAIVVPGNPAATAGNIVSMQVFWRLGIAAEFVALVCAIALAMIYFVLLRPVSKELVLLATFLRLVSLTVQAIAVLYLGAALFPLVNAGSLKAFSPEQLETLAYLAIRLHSYGFGVALLVIGWCFLIHGYLILKSGFLPKVIGILIQVAGLSYLINSFALILAPAVANAIFPAILLPAFIGETTLSVWLLVKGVHVANWRQAIAAAR